MNFIFESLVLEGIIGYLMLLLVGNYATRVSLVIVHGLSLLAFGFESEALKVLSLVFRLHVMRVDPSLYGYSCCSVTEGMIIAYIICSMLARVTVYI